MVNGEWSRFAALQPYSLRLGVLLHFRGGCALNDEWVMNQAYLLIDQFNYAVGHYSGVNLVCCHTVNPKYGAQKFRSMPQPFL